MIWRTPFCINISNKLSFEYAFCKNENSIFSSLSKSISFICFLLFYFLNLHKHYIYFLLLIFIILLMYQIHYQINKKIYVVVLNHSL